MRRLILLVLCAVAWAQEGTVQVGNYTALNVTKLASDPSPCTASQIWYNTTSQLYRYCPSGTAATVGSGSGSGNVTGAASSTTNNIALFGDTSGKLISDAGFGFPLAASHIGTLSAGLNGLGTLATQATPCLPSQGCTGSTTNPATGTVATGNGSNVYAPVALSTSATLNPLQPPGDVQIPNSGTLCWLLSSLCNIGISLDAAPNVIDFGNGTQGDASATTQQAANVYTGAKPLTFDYGPGDSSVPAPAAGHAFTTNLAGSGAFGINQGNTGWTVSPFAQEGYCAGLDNVVCYGALSSGLPNYLSSSTNVLTISGATIPLTMYVGGLRQQLNANVTVTAANASGSSQTQYLVEVLDVTAPLALVASDFLLTSCAPSYQLTVPASCAAASPTNPQLWYNTASNRMTSCTGTCGTASNFTAKRALPLASMTVANSTGNISAIVHFGLQSNPQQQALVAGTTMVNGGVGVAPASAATSIDLGRYIGAANFVQTGTPTIDVTQKVNNAIAQCNSSPFSLGCKIIVPPGHYLLQPAAGTWITLPITTGGVRFECATGKGVMYTGGANSPCAFYLNTPGAIALGTPYNGTAVLDPGPTFDAITVIDMTASHNGGGAGFFADVNSLVLNDFVVNEISSAAFAALPIAAPVGAPSCSGSGSGSGFGAGTFQVYYSFMSTLGPSMPSPACSTTITAGQNIVVTGLPTSFTFPAIGTKVYVSTAGGTTGQDVSPAPAWTTNADGSLTLTSPITTSSFTATGPPVSARNMPVVDHSASAAIKLEGGRGLNANGFVNQPYINRMVCYHCGRAIDSAESVAALNIQQFQGSVCDINPATGACSPGQTGTSFMQFNAGLVGFTGHTDGSFTNSTVLTLQSSGAQGGHVVGPGVLFENSNSGTNGTAVSLIGSNRNKVDINVSSMSVGYSIDASSRSNDLKLHSCGGNGCATNFSDANATLAGACSSFNRCTSPVPGVSASWVQGSSDSTALATTLVYQSHIDNDTTFRYQRDANGAQFWGPGTAGAIDTSFYRSSANTLSVGDGVTSNANGNVAAKGIISQSYNLCANVTASGTAQTCSTAPTFTVVAGSCFTYTTTTANSGTGLTINPNSLGATSVSYQGSTTLAANYVKANQEVSMCYDGTNLELSKIDAATLNAVNAQTGTYQVLASDFSGPGCKLIQVASGTFAVTLVASGSQPANGQCIDILNYGTGTVTVTRSGQNINNVAANITLNAGSVGPSAMQVVSDGTNYFAFFHNAEFLSGKTWSVPSSIGTTTPNTGAFTTLTGTTVNTTTNCSSSASPAVCASAAAGSVAVPTGTNPTLVVNTTAVTANSQIFVQSDDSLGTKLSITCNSTLASLAVEPVVTARTGGTSFTVQINGVISTNAVCLSYFIVN